MKPLRISLFGGGTDYPSWFELHSGIVLGGPINKSIYWEYSEDSKELDIIKKVSSFLGITVEDCLTLRNSKFLSKGLGASSASISSLIETVSNKVLSRNDLISKVTYFEQEYLKKNAGNQDQILVNSNKFKVLRFSKDNVFEDDEEIPRDTIHTLNAKMYIVESKKKRDGELKEINFEDNAESLGAIKEIAEEALVILKDKNFNESEFHRLLNLSWKYKKKILTDSDVKFFEEEISEIFKMGASSVKLLGAGGGGYYVTFFDRKPRPSSFNEVIKVEFLE